VTYALATLVVVGVLIAILLVIVNRDANQTIKKRNFDRVAQGTRPRLVIVPKEQNTAATTTVSANVAGSSWPGESTTQSFGTSGRVQ
jgi:hypothetical protein